MYATLAVAGEVSVRWPAGRRRLGAPPV